MADSFGLKIGPQGEKEKTEWREMKAAESLFSGNYEKKKIFRKKNFGRAMR